MNESFDMVVVGGGVAGLLAALRAAEAGTTVLLLDRATALGGLLRSTKSEKGLWFDHGTHIPARTGRPDLDRLLFDDLEDIDWHVFDKLRKGNYFVGELNTRTQFIDITQLPAHAYLQGFVDTLCRVTEAPPGSSLEAVLRARHGEYLVRTMFAPLIERIYRQPLSALSDRAHRFLAYTRIVVADSDVSRELKMSPAFDSKIAFTNASEGGDAGTYMYPATGGCGAWITALRRAIERRGVLIRTQATIDALDPVNRSLTVSSQAISYGHLVWTAPLAQLARLIDPAASWEKPAFVPTRLYHFDLSSPPLCNAHYLYINTPHMVSFRVTLYGNITSERGDHRITVEAVDYEGQKNVEHILGELVEAKIVSDDTKIRHSFTQALTDGFPVLTLQAVAQNARAAETVCRYPFITPAGRGGGEAFFMNDVIREVDNSMNRLFGDPNAY